MRSGRTSRSICCASRTACSAPSPRASSQSERALILRHRLAGSRGRVVIRRRARQAAGVAAAAEAIGDHDHDRGDGDHGEAEHGDGADVAAFLEVEDQDRQDLGLRREQDHGGRQLADHRDEDEAPGRDHRRAQQRRGDVGQRAQPRGAQHAAGFLELGMHRMERRGELLVGGRQLDGDEGDEQDPQRAVERERRARVGEEQADAQHDAGDGERRGGEEAQQPVSGNGAAGDDVGDQQRQQRAHAWPRRSPAGRCSRAPASSS